MQKWCLGCNFIVANTQLSLFIWKFLLHVCYVEVFCEITTLIISVLHNEIIPRSTTSYTIYNYLSRNNLGSYNIIWAEKLGYILWCMNKKRTVLRLSGAVLFFD